MADRSDENLPEVVPDTSPQVLTHAEAYKRRGLEEGEPKYTVIYDLNTHKIPTSDPIAGDVETPTTPAPAYRPPVDDGAGAFAPDAEKSGAAAPAGEKEGPKILGMKRRTFLIVLVVAIIILAAAIGGGIGGSQAAKQGASSSAKSIQGAEVAGSPSATTEPDDDESKDDDSSDDESSDDESSDSEASDAGGNGATASDAKEEHPTSSAIKPKDTESSSSSTKKSTSASPTPTSKGGASGGASEDDHDEEGEDSDEDDDEDDDNDRPKPGFTFRGWKDKSFKGESTDIVATTGFLDLPFNIKSYKWQPLGTDCCVTMCQGKKKNVGWRCTTFNRGESSEAFGRIFIGCGAEAGKGSSRCS